MTVRELTKKLSDVNNPDAVVYFLVNDVWKCELSKAIDLTQPPDRDGIIGNLFLKSVQLDGYLEGGVL